MWVSSVFEHIASSCSRSSSSSLQDSMVVIGRAFFGTEKQQKRRELKKIDGGTAKLNQSAKGRDFFFKKNLCMASEGAHNARLIFTLVLPTCSRCISPSFTANSTSLAPPKPRSTSTERRAILRNVSRGRQREEEEEGGDSSSSVVAPEEV